MNILRRLINKIVIEYNEYYKYPSLVKGKTKIFCIGRNKTGTTSLKKAFEDLNYIVGNQRKAEKLLPDYKENNFGTIVQYCSSARVFQDFPFSYPGTFRHLDKAYPGSKFILTLRDSPEQWYNSLIKFHAKKFGNGNIPTKSDLKNAGYVWKGWVWQCNRIMYDTPDEDPYNKEMMIETYKNYNQSVIEYFQNRPNDLIIINLAKRGSYQKLMHFLNIDSPFSDFPWENKTSKI